MSFAQPPNPPNYAVIFTSMRAAVDEGYGAVAARGEVEEGALRSANGEGVATRRRLRNSHGCDDYWL